MTTSQQYDKLNRYTSREVPGVAQSVGTANATANATLWGDNGAYASTERKGTYFRGELAVDNRTGPVWLTVTNVGVGRSSGSDVVSATTGKMFVAQTPEVFGYDTDGNLTSDGGELGGFCRPAW